ncbi:MAG TPA: 30S ribosomal protein S20, partial [Candidatus Wirthbacteria bacterium]|nr:30S ribosomal protein S20 [Candidatus Wirthbacteria bacterium]
TRSKSALKRVGISKKRNERNNLYRTKARTAVKKTNEALAHKDADAAQSSALEAVRALDIAASKGVIHKNNAARRKSRLLKKVNSLETTAEA